jgi:hypothetical protein
MKHYQDKNIAQSYLKNNQFKTLKKPNNNSIN